MKTDDREIDGGLKIRIYTPPNYTMGSNNVGLYIHGGGWAMGDLNTDDSDCRAISKGAGVVLVAVDYTLSTEKPYPAGLNDYVQAFNWTLKNAESLGGKVGKLFIAGAPAGGGSSFGLARE